MSRFLTAITRSRAGSWVTKNIYFPIDRALLRLTGGKRGLSSHRVTLNLTTTGAKSGMPRSVPILYLRDDETFWVMASNFGQDRHPAWSYNLLENPKARVQIAGETLDVTARLATDEEKERLWPRLLELYPSWKQYRTWTDREFRLFALETTHESV